MYNRVGSINSSIIAIDYLCAWLFCCVESCFVVCATTDALHTGIIVELL